MEFKLTDVVEFNADGGIREGVICRVWPNGRYVTINIGTEAPSLFVREVANVRPSANLAAWRESKGIDPYAR